MEAPPRLRKRTGLDCHPLSALFSFSRSAFDRWLATGAATGPHDTTSGSNLIKRRGRSNSDAWFRVLTS